MQVMTLARPSLSCAPIGAKVLQGLGVYNPGGSINL
jgi:hypothetical protein